MRYRIGPESDNGAGDYDDSPSPTELAELMQWLENETARHKREEAAEPSLAEFAVEWDDITLERVAAFRGALNTASVEADMQAFLEANPNLLVQPLGGGHGRWVIPEKRLGSEHRADFMIGQKSTVGFEWVAVELEGPQRKMFNKNGEANQWLTHAIGQINDWRDWISRNRDYAARPRTDKGLGLVDIDGEVPGWIIMGRSSEASPETHDRRRRLARQHNIKIHSYDWLVERALARCAELTAWRRGEEMD
ncbi:Shedu anti-phage system protein SduA domain-containing protein [Rhodococcus opacus]|uniref:Shedu protein SduA C-terminal domain-containing protein n=1 Tax=Rhodococcus opacus TaxID=37919 RepID=A0A2S8IWG2_RHOOP|nr:Shedu anti-phage system protein SduA domain-containing protein [Rhodococcus opacus]PQP19019.1 hypothetical protein C5613_31470 [Rhodococcus opacus]